MSLGVKNVGVLLNNFNKSKFLNLRFSASNSRINVSSFNDIPRAPALRYVGSIPYLLKVGGIPELHNYIDSMHNKLGPIFIDRMWNTDIVYLADADSNYRMFQKEGFFPQHVLPELWTTHIADRKIKRGLLFMNDDEWVTSREQSNKVLARSEVFDDYEKDTYAITRELLDIWRTNPPENLKYDLYNWNAECIGIAAFGKRLGFLEKLKFFNKHNEKHVEEDKLVKAALGSFSKSPTVLLPVKWQKMFKMNSWKMYYEATDFELGTVEKYVEDAIQECLSPNPSEKVKLSLLYKLMKLKRLPLETVKIIVIDVFISSCYSVANAATWALYHLGRNPDVAEKVRRQIRSVVAKGKVFRLNELENELPYINGTIKESLRISPTAPIINRIMPNDTTLFGHNIPKGTIVSSSQYSMGKDPKYFSNPESFFPERWFSDQYKEKEKLTHLTRSSRAFSPFAFYRRSCIGKKLALAYMKILILESVKSYEWTTDEVRPTMSFVLVPSKPIKLKIRS